LRKLADEVADYFLFVGEAPPPARLTPRAGFATQFTGAGPKDARGRSLRELDLTSRLLKYPCSYMIYSQAFDNLPAAAKLAVYQRIHAVLTSTSTGASTHLSAADRQAILEILNETKGDWPKAFTPRARRL
jgi:hypothetical protein